MRQTAAIGVVGILLGALLMPVVQAQSATFLNVKDAVAGRAFDAATTVPDPASASRLLIGFNAGTDPTDWSSTAFTASSAAFSRPAMSDTLSLTVQAPAGYYVARVTYVQRGTVASGRGSTARAVTHLTVAGKPEAFEFTNTAPAVNRTVDVSSLKLALVPVTVTTSLSVVAASVSVTSAEILVDLLPR